MQTIATDDRGVCLSICCATTAEQIELPFGVKIPKGKRNIVLTGILIPQEGGGD